jgi:hypothetical protein
MPQRREAGVTPPPPLDAIGISVELILLIPLEFNGSTREKQLFGDFREFTALIFELMTEFYPHGCG